MGDNKKIIQQCVRTYPNSWTKTTELLNELLSQGYFVKMCHEISCNNSEMCLEYIVEKVADNA